MAWLAASACLLALACGDRECSAPEQGAARGPLHADSAAPDVRQPDTASNASALAQFRSTLVRPSGGLEGGADSRQALVTRVVTALASADTGALRRMAVSRAEYAWLIYPESPLVHPPYRQPIDVAWMLHAAPHAKGFTRLLERLAGRLIRFQSVTCNPEPVIQGANRFWTGCTVRFTLESEAVEMQLFAAIVERDGALKVMSYDNDF